MEDYDQAIQLAGAMPLRELGRELRTEHHPSSSSQARAVYYGCDWRWQVASTRVGP